MIEDCSNPCSPSTICSCSEPNQYYNGPDFCPLLFDIDDVEKSVLKVYAYYPLEIQPTPPYPPQTELEPGGTGVVISRLNTSCSDTLVNNVVQPPYANKFPYVLTARHCALPSPPPSEDVRIYDFSTDTDVFFRFSFDYRADACNIPKFDPSTYILTHGATIMLDCEASDMLLLQMKQEIPDFFPAHYAGWTANAEGDILNMGKEMWDTINENRIKST